MKENLHFNRRIKNKINEDRVDRTVRNALNAYENYKRKYGTGDALFNLKYNFHLTNEELVWILNKLIKKNLIDEADVKWNINYLNLEDYEDQINLPKEDEMSIEELKKMYGMNESYLDDDEEFWDYGTEKIDGNKIFDKNVGESSFARDMIKLANSGKVDKDGRYAYFEEMTPIEYFKSTAKGFGNTINSNISAVEHDTSTLNKLNDVLHKYNKKFPITYLDYSYGNFGQEGRHRMYVAAKNFGWDTKFPVLIIKTTDDATKEHNDDRIRKYISKALLNTERYAYDSVDDIKEQFLYDIESYIDNPKVEVIDRDDYIVFKVNGVEVYENKEYFNLVEPEENTDIDLDDFDIDDLK